MKLNKITLTVVTVFIALLTLATIPSAMGTSAEQNANQRHFFSMQLGSRPFYLVEQMDNSALKTKLQRCANKPLFRKTDFSIGHRGAPLQFPEHTKESYEAAARQGAGILECDVTFTMDGELVCRHAQCDLHTTTNILETPLRDLCTTPPVFGGGDGEQLLNPGEVKCCTSDLTLSQFKTLKGKMDAANASATTVEEFLDATANWRTDLYATGGTLLSHKESIELFHSLGAKFTPELKGPDRDANTQVEDVFGSQAGYAQKLIDEYKAAGINPSDVWAQSFNLDDVLYWINNEPTFGEQAVFLDGRPVSPDLPTEGPTMEELVDQDVNIIAPPMPMLLTVENGSIVPSDYAKAAKSAGLDIITWTLERSGRIVEDVLEGGNTFYYQTTLDALNNDGDIMKTLDVLAQDVGIIGIFSDWPATVTYYANCMGL